jgi:hypothetical protein
MRAAGPTDPAYVHCQVCHQLPATMLLVQGLGQAALRWSGAPGHFPVSDLPVQDKCNAVVDFTTVSNRQGCWFWRWRWRWCHCA